MKSISHSYRIAAGVFCQELDRESVLLNLKTLPPREAGRVR